MFLAEFLFSLVLAVLLTAFFGFAGGRYAPWPGLLWLFAVLLLGTWALGVWLQPIGPPVRGFYWASFVVAVLVLALLLAAAASAPRPLERQRREELEGVEIRPVPPSEEQAERRRAEAEAAGSLGAVFWALLVLALVALVAHYTLA